jgi:putative transposase
VNLPEAQRTIEAWRTEYNTARPHTSLDGRTPEEFAEELNLVQLHPKPDDR